MARKEHDVERPFVVDGIKEYDNPLPSWWLALFYLTILFSPLYLVYTHFLEGHLLLDDLDADRSAHAELMAEQEEKRLEESGGDLLARLADSAVVAAGADVYQTNCAACHGDKGQGVVGPNLTDPYWIHGGSPQNIMNVINNGVVEKGMIAWQAILGQEKIEQVTAFVISLKGSNPPNPKAPQGELYESSAESEQGTER